MSRTDYVPGEEPVPVGTVVEYSGHAQPHGFFKVIGHLEPHRYPHDPPAGHPLNELFPDGVGYDLWPVGVPRKFGLAHLSVLFARRTSFKYARPTTGDPK